MGGKKMNGIDSLSLLVFQVRRDTPDYFFFLAAGFFLVELELLTLAFFAIFLV